MNIKPILLIVAATFILSGGTSENNSIEIEDLEYQISELEEKIEEYENCLQHSRYQVEEAMSRVEYPEDYGIYNALEEANSFLDNTDFCGL